MSPMRRMQPVEWARPMRPTRRTALMLATTTLAVASTLGLSACDIPATGVVEAGGPASGVPATIAIYLIRDGALVAVPRTIADPGEPASAVEALLQGPTPQERRKGLTSALAGRSTSAPPTRAPSLFSPSSAEPSTEQVKELWVTTRNDQVYVELPLYSGKLSALAANQVSCTAARAYLLTRRDLDSTTVTVTDATGRTFEGDDGRCPEL